MEYYFTDKENINLKESSLLIKGFEYKHLTKVLRKSLGDRIIITDGTRNIYECLIVEIKKDFVLCNILESRYDLYEPEIRAHLFVSPLRNANRFEFLIEKAVELGVFEINPVVSKFTVQKSTFSETKLERFRKIVISAMGQSQRCYLPKINNTISFRELIRITKEYNNKIVYYEDDYESKNVISDSNISNDICIFIGPEGGFDKSEIDLLVNDNWKVKSLGNRKLRAETAAIISVFENISKHK